MRSCIYINDEATVVVDDATSFDLAELNLKPGAYKVQVCAVDEDGEHGELSEGVTFTVYHL